MMPIRPRDTSRPAVSKSQIPSIKELLHLLGFQGASVKDERKFTKAVHNWRKSYKTSDGRSGCELVEWKNAAVQSDLMAMANNFIDSSHNGETFWSPRINKNDSSIQFPNDRPRIAELLKQLFFNQNHYAKRNNDYAQKKTSTDDPRGPVSPLRHTSTTSKSPLQPKTKKAKQQDKESVVTLKYRTHGKPETTLHNKKDNTQEGSKRKISEKVQTTRSTEAKEHVPDSVEDNIYDFPSDEDDIHISRKSPSLISTYETTRNHHPRRRHWDSDQEPVNKRQKLDNTPRRTSRLPQPRIIPEAIPDAEVDRYIEENDGPSDDDAQSHEDGAMDKGLHSPSTATMGNSQDEASYISPYLPEQSGFKTFTAPVAPMFAADPENSGEAHQQDSRRKDKSATPILESFKISPNIYSPRADSFGIFSAASGPHHDTNNYQATAMTPSSLDQTPQPLHRISSLGTCSIDEIDLTGEAGEEEDQSFHRSLPPQVVTSRQPSHEAFQDLDPDGFGFTSEVKEWKEDFGGTNEVITPVLNQDAFFNPVKASPDNNGSGGSNDAQIKLSPSDQIIFNMDPFSNGAVPDNHTPPRKPTPTPQVVKAVKGTHVIFWVVTHEPIRKQKCWDEGRIQGKDLSTFLEDVSMFTNHNDIEKLNLTLNTAFSVVELTVYKENEDSWVRAKQTFAKTLKETQKLRKGKSLDEHDESCIFIEPFYAANTTPEGTEEEMEDEIEF